MPSLVHQTELDAVNLMLSYAGYSETTTLEGTLPLDVALAQNTLHRMSRQIQSKGLSCNVDLEVTLSPAPAPGEGDDWDEGDILVPADSLRCTPHERWRQLVERDGKMYDLDNKTFTFTDSVTFDITRFQGFSTLPEPVKNHVSYQALVRFLTAVSADPVKRDMAIQEAQVAYREFETYEVAALRPSMLDNSEVLAHMGVLPVYERFP